MPHLILLPAGRFGSALLALPLLTACAGLPKLPGVPPSFAVAVDGGPAAAGGRRLAGRGCPSRASSSCRWRPPRSRPGWRSPNGPGCSLDLQYYEWHGDATGRYLIAVLRRAAERGVRVRVLVDDLHSDGVDELLSGLAAFDNAEVRLFNPFVRRRGSQLWKLVSSLDELSRVNHRMHNKMFVADNAFAVFGGRNIGDKYFMRSPERNFIDLDILAAGPVVQALSASFDTYWNSEYAYPIDLVLPTAASRAERQAGFDAALGRDRAAAARSHRPAALSALRHGPGRPRCRMAAPGRGPRRAACRPARQGRGHAPDLAQRNGARLRRRVHPRGADPRRCRSRRISFPATAAWRRSRCSASAACGCAFSPTRWPRPTSRSSTPATDATSCRCCKNGVEVYELSPSLARQRARLGRFGDSLGMLHAKILVIDRARLFISSLNIDGRSERYNTELGVLIDSAELAEDVLEMLDFEGSSYALRLDASGEGVEWVSGSGERQQVLTTEPETDAWLRFKSRFLGLLLPENWL